jgi:hypothetical protein
MKQYCPKAGGGKTSPNNKKKKQTNTSSYLQIIFVLQLREREQAKLKCLKRISLLQ